MGQGRARGVRPRQFAYRRSLLLWLLAALAAAVTDARATTNATDLLLPSAAAYDTAGDLFVVDTDRNQVIESTLGGALIVVAGSAVQGFGGDGGPATAALLNAPRGIAFGADGTMYIADTGNQRVRAVKDGVISTFAGDGVRGWSGDGGLAPATSLAIPTALAVDASGALLICDTANERVRRVSNGVITTFAGSGVEGFAGDGGSATAAELDSPEGLAVGADGSVYIADTGNERVRVVLASGVIRTIAGTGQAGYGGDSGSAVSAELDRPMSLAVAAGRQLLIADSGNRRLRSVDASGMISTIAGSGVQGVASEGSVAVQAMMSAPRGLAISAFAQPVMTDALGHGVWVVSAAGVLYRPAGWATGRASTAKLTADSGPMVYGQAVAAVSVTGSVGVAQGPVAMTDGTTTFASGALTAGGATLTMPSLPAGEHTIVAQYGGDGLNPAAQSSPITVVVTPAPVVATADAVSMFYGDPLPALTGQLSGVLAQDAAEVRAVFSTTASSSSPVGSYAIAANLTGAESGNYALVAGGGSGSLAIEPALTTVAVQAVAQSAYAGLPLLLSAVVWSGTAAAAVGTVQFFDGGSAIGQASVANGSASVVELQPQTGGHAITAQFMGAPNFAGSTSAPLEIGVSALPDFTVAASGAVSQTVAAGTAASYVVMVTGQQAPFTGGVVLSVTGLPEGATASFAPPELVPGAGAASSTLTVQTRAVSGAVTGWPPLLWLMSATAGALAFRRKQRLGAGGCGLLLCGSILALGGCGARTVSVSSVAVQSYTLTVTGTGTNLAGNVVAHSTTVVLKVE